MNQTNDLINEQNVVVFFAISCVLLIVMVVMLNKREE